MRHTRRDKAQIARFWNAVVEGEPPDLDGLDPDLGNTITTLHTGDDVPLPDQTFARQLEDRLMEQWLTQVEGRSPSRWTLPGREPHQPRSGGPSREVRPVHREIISSRATDRFGFRRLAGTAAAIALLLVTVTGILLTLDRAGDGDQSESINLGAATGTPQPPIDDPRWTCTRPNPFTPCRQALSSVGDTMLTVDQIDPADLDVRRVQLQEWQLEPGAELAGDLTADVPGVIVDVVLGGAYAAAFDIPITVYRQSLPAGMGGPMPDDVPAGTAIELAVGDAVAYPIGAQRSVRNPLTHLPLRFKRAVFADDQRAFPPSSPDAEATETGEIKQMVAGEGWTMRADGENTLAEPLSTVSSSDVAFQLAYVRIPDGATFPPDWCCIVTAIGPVAPEPWEGQGTIVEGYVLFVSEPKG